MPGSQAEQTSGNLPPFSASIPGAWASGAGDSHGSAGSGVLPRVPAPWDSGWRPGHEVKGYPGSVDCFGKEDGFALPYL